MTTYVDASVLLRVVLGEPVPLATWETITPVASELIRVESLRAIERYRLLGALYDAAVAETRSAVFLLLGGFQLVQVTSSVLERAADPFPTLIATLDAIHLATALILREEGVDLEFATHDATLATAARSTGFTVVGA